MKLDDIYKGKYIPVNKEKYVGDISSITYRSSWERAVMKWADFNPDIQYWNSEETTVKYICGTDGALHTYYIDFTFKFKTGKVLLVEVKPEAQTREPKVTKGKKKTTLLTEQLAFVKNRSKWKAAIKYAKDNNASFQIWTEKTLRKLGILI